MINEKEAHLPESDRIIFLVQISSWRGDLLDLKNLDPTPVTSSLTT
ncbi:MAG: hypothetical protein LBM09_03250 [Candidatus Nomurabacteria bacterium]|nr:hypothetical protein [Candidatus Nomurabacteria bacterium]